MHQFLTTLFARFDYGVLLLVHNFAVATDYRLTGLVEAICLIAEKGVLFFTFGAVLMLFKRTKKDGACVFLAVFLGGVIVDLVLKNVVARPRPFASMNIEYFEWWKALNIKPEENYSFPSGHATASSAFATALLLRFDKRYSWCFIPVSFLVGLGRIYLVVHYPTDVLTGFATGMVSAFVSSYLTDKIFDFLENQRDKKIVSAFLDFTLK